MLSSASPALANDLVETISLSLYSDFVFYYKYASSAYVPGFSCPKPNGNTFVYQIYDFLTDTQGFIARDDARKEIVISLRGSASLQDFLTDANIPLIPFKAPGVSKGIEGVRVHAGFLTAWISVADQVLERVKNQLSSHPGYEIVTTGHSLGGALSSLAAITMKENFPAVPVRMYTYGQPRTGNVLYAELLDRKLGLDSEFRVVHTTDPVPHVPLRAWGYHHHGVEYWIRKDPANFADIKKCTKSEDPTCSNSIPLAVDLATPAHISYFDILASTPFCL